MIPESMIVIDREIFNHLPPETKLDALILKKLGRLTIQDPITNAPARGA